MDGIVDRFQIIFTMIKRTKSIDYHSDTHQRSQSQLNEHTYSEPNKQEQKKVQTNPKTPQKDKRETRVQKLPNKVRENIMKMSSGKKTLSSMTKSRMTKSMFDHVRKAISKPDTFLCEICACEYQNQEKRQIGKQCKHQFCINCLRHYTEYKISRFEQVICPTEDCPQTIDVNGQFFENLTPQLKKKYKKVHAFYQVSQNGNLRLCPDEKCEDGIVELAQGIIPKCNKCGKLYCEKCMFPVHEGLCDKNQIDFFQNNLHFRQCFKCKAVIEKIQGCKHITCKCGYQFCYQCGAKWRDFDHPCGLDELGRPIDQPCCECCEACDCNCRPECNCFLSALCKILLLPLFLILESLVIALMLVLISGGLVLTIFLGAFPYTFQIICKFSCPWIILFTLLYPLFMLAGICIALMDIFCELSAKILHNFCDMSESLVNCLFCW